MTDLIYVPQKTLEEIVAAWDPPKSLASEFRLPLCAKCGQEIDGPMYHCWLEDRYREIHLCATCGAPFKDRTLIVVAAYDDQFRSNLDTFGGGDGLVVVDTSEGGHPSEAFKKAYHEHPNFTSYLFLQDSMKGIVPDVVAPFRGRSPVVAWAGFGMAFDTPGQEAWVLNQYPGVTVPTDGIFGPTFYATREALEATEPFFPHAPDSKMMAQGTERAWAFAFAAAGVQVESLYGFDPEGFSRGTCPPFSKVFANRQ